MIGLKFLLQGSQFFIAFLPEQEAHQILNKWIKGEYDLNGPARIGKIQPEGSWVIDVKSIACIHTITREELMGQVAQQAPQQQMVSGVALPMKPWGQQ